MSSPFERIGTLKRALGHRWTAFGPPNCFIGEVCELLDGQKVLGHAEVLGFNGPEITLMPYLHQTLKEGMRIRATGLPLSIPVGPALLGRVINAFGEPIDGKGPILTDAVMPLLPSSINPMNRLPINEPYHTNITAIDALLPLGKGQRTGIFAGSGVGKSTLLGQLCQHTNADVQIIALIGERGREVNAFIQQYLTQETLDKSIVIVATSDMPAIFRRLSALSAHAIGRYFSQDSHVVLYLDSITRLAMAEREIGLSLGEPPTSRGYTPGIFSLLPRLIEQAGKFSASGSFTAIYTVLVEGDDLQEPMTDTLRALLDGHIVLSRILAEAAHYPAIDILKSSSRLADDIVSEVHLTLIQKAKQQLSLYEQNKTLIALGAYKSGQDSDVDKAIQVQKNLKTFLTEKEKHPPSILFQRLKDCIS